IRCTAASASLPAISISPMWLTSKMPARVLTARCSAVIPEYSIGISHPLNATIRALDALWREWSGVFLRAEVIVSVIGSRCGAIRVYCEIRSREMLRSDAQRRRCVRQQTIQHAANHRRRHRACRRKLVRLEERAAPVDQEHVEVADTGKIVRILRRNHDRGAAIALRFDGARQPMCAVDIEPLPRFVEHDQREVSARQHGSEPEQLPCA